MPAAAAIANVDITTNNFEAEFGRAVGTVVNVTLKSGTNSFHGSVFQNMENNGVNARNYFAAGPNGRLVYNYTGASIGGPILKDKLFFFGDFLRVSDHEETSYVTNVPFYNVQGGNLNLSGYSGQVYDTQHRRRCRLPGRPHAGKLRPGSHRFCGQYHSALQPGNQPGGYHSVRANRCSCPQSQDQPGRCQVRCGNDHQQLLCEPSLSQGCMELRRNL